MKNLTFLIILILSVFFFTSCSPGNELQVEMSMMELKKIDTLYRTGNEKYCYSWFDRKNRVMYSEYRDSSNFNLKYMWALIKK